MRGVFCVAGIKSTFITIRKRFVQLDQDTAKLPSYYSVCLVRQHTDKSSGCPYSGTVSRPAVLIAPSDLITLR
jgi:hypothetical protein